MLYYAMKPTGFQAINIRNFRDFQGNEGVWRGRAAKKK